MIKFSDKQLKIPQMQRPVFLVTGGMSKFDRSIPEKRTEELVIDSFVEAAEFINKTPAELKEYIHSCYYGHFADHFGDQLLGEAVIHDRLGLDPLGNVGIKTGGATGGSTLWEAFKAVASGYSDCVLAMGWERMDEVPTDEGNNYIASAADKDWETPLGHIYTGYYAVMAQKYWQVFGKEEESFRHTMAEIAVKNRGYARMNPHAQGPMDITVEDVLNSPVVAYPLRALDCCLMSVGASCAILCDEKTAYELTDNPLIIYVSAGSHTLRVADRRDMDIPLLPNESPDQYKDLGERFPGGDRYPALRVSWLPGWLLITATEWPELWILRKTWTWWNCTMLLPSAISRHTKILVSGLMVKGGPMWNLATVITPIPILGSPENCRRIFVADSSAVCTLLVPRELCRPLKWASIFGDAGRKCTKTSPNGTASAAPNLMTGPTFR